MTIAQKTPSNRPFTPWESPDAGDNIRAINRVSRLGFEAAAPGDNQGRNTPWHEKTRVPR
jgi:hypothetical protein